MRLASVLTFLLLSGCAAKTAEGPSAVATAAPVPLPDYAAIVAAPDRTDADRALDEGRHPAQLLAFFGLRPGMNVADIGAGGGYTTELLARTVAPGQV